MRSRFLPVVGGVAPLSVWSLWGSGLGAGPFTHIRGSTRRGGDYLCGPGGCVVDYVM
jgi:hypothetical protein